MLFKWILFCALVISPALSSAIKGYSQQREEAPPAPKGYLPLQREEAKGYLPQQREETKGYLPQQREETKGYLPQQREEIKGAPRPILTAPIEQQREEIKGYSQQREEAPPAPKGYLPLQRDEIKGAQRPLLASPIEQQRLIEQHQVAKSSVKLEHRDHSEQTQLVAEHRNDELVQQQKEEALPVRTEETKGKLTEQQPLKYEAKPQVKREELSKIHQQKFEQREELSKVHQQKFEQREELSKVHQQKFEQRDELDTRPPVYEQRVEELGKPNHRFEQAPIIQRDYDQQIELKEEQRRYEEPSALVQPILPLTVVEETRIEQLPASGGFKGAGQLREPTGAAPLGLAEPYAFNYQVDGSSRSESGDVNGAVKGQYTVQGADGSNRVVDYVADHNGFRASVNTNEFGTEARSPANVQLRSSQPNAEDITLRLEGKTREDLLAPQAPLFKGAAPVPTRPENWSATKGGVAAPLPLAQVQEETIKTAPIIKRPIVETPAKGQRLTQQVEEQRLDEFIQQDQAASPIKSGEYRAPVKADLKQQPTIVNGGLSRNFESATAHRVYRAGHQTPAYLVPVNPPRPLVPGVVVRAHPPPPPPPAVSRAHLQQHGVRHPASPAQNGYRRHLVDRQPVNPRVSFYSTYDEDRDPASFEHSDS